METLGYLAHGMATAFEPFNFAVMIIGLFIGVIAGAVPGISFVNAMALSLPFTYLMSPLVAMMFLGGIYVGGVFGGSISSILVNIPGDPDSVPSCWDGYPIAQRDGVVVAGAGPAGPPTEGAHHQCSASSSSVRSTAPAT